MSVLNVVVSPDYCWFDIHRASSKFGIPCEFFKPRRDQTVESPAPASSKYLGPLKVVYVEEVESFRRSGALQALESNRVFEFLVIIGCTENRFNRLPVYSGTVDSLVEAHLSFSREGESSEISFEEAAPYIEAMSRYQRDSVLTKVSQLLYRIRDKTDRAATALDVYRFLSGGRKRAPRTPINSLDLVLKGEIAKRYNQAGSAVRGGMDVDKVCSQFKVDRFEVGYCMRKSQVSDEMLERIAFKE